MKGEWGIRLEGWPLVVLVVVLSMVVLSIFAQDLMLLVVRTLGEVAVNLAKALRG